MARLFVAVWPPPSVVRVLTDLPRPDMPGLRWTGSDQWHVTLRFFGHVDDVDATVAAFRTIVAQPAVAVLGPLTGRFGDRVLHAPVEGLAEVAAAVAAATSGIGEPLDERPFKGHITLARPRGRARVRLGPLAGTPIEAQWPVEE